MIHTFSLLDKHFCLDVFSGSLLQVDEIVKKILLSNSSDYNSGEFLPFSKDEFNSALKEVEALKREGILDSKPALREPSEFNGVIKSMCLNITHRCNLACSYCFADGGDYGASDKGDMTLETAKAAIDFLIEKSSTNYNLEVDFFGGEPLLNFEVVKGAVEYARSLEQAKGKKFRFTLTTNALHLPDTAIDFINSQMHNVVISIDGRKEVHNYNRSTKNKSPSFDIVLENAKRLTKNRKADYFVRGTFTSDNLDFTNDVLAMYDYGFKGISLEPVVLKENHPQAITQKHVPQIVAEYEKLAGKYLEYRQSGKWFTFFHFNLNLYDGPCEKKLLSSCGAGCGYIAVTPSGKIYPCHQFISLPAYEIGDVIKKQYDKTIPLKFGSKNTVTAKPKCSDCWAQYYCSGGCAAANVKYSGTISEPCPVSCELMKKRIECALAIFAIENS